MIIILAAIVIFTGLRTPDSAQFAKFTQDVDNVQTAVRNKYADLKTKHAITKEYRTDEQIYIEIATAVDPGQYASMNTTSVKSITGASSITEGTGIQNIVADYSNVADGASVNVEVYNGTETSTVPRTATGSLGMTLPTVREYNKAWYVTAEGRVFNANGYTYNGKTYYDAKHYQEGEQGSNSEANAGRALAVYNVIKADNITVTGAPEDGTATETLHTVTYNANGGTGEVASQTETSITLSDGAGLTAPNGKVFAGWNTSADGSGTAYTSGQVVSIDLNLYAQWGAPVISKATTGDGFVGYYADIDNNGTVDGIIYADLLVGTTGTIVNGHGRWNNDTWSDYDIPKISDTSTIKDYVVSSKTYTGQTEAGKYESTGFGVKDVLVPAVSTEGTLDRFYIMTLTNFTTDSKESFYWYKNASGLDNIVGTSVIDFGSGKQNTINMLSKWNNGDYGTKTTTGDKIDLWGAIQDGQYNLVQATGDNSKKWFIPSKSEWAAFGGELGITKSGTGSYTSKGLSDYYWASSQRNADTAYCAGFGTGYILNGFGNYNYCVRLSATF